MSLLVILDKDGRSHLIHSSQIGAPPRPARAIGEWSTTWARFDARHRRIPAPAGGRFE